MCFEIGQILGYKKSHTHQVICVPCVSLAERMHKFNHIQFLSDDEFLFQSQRKQKQEKLKHESPWPNFHMVLSSLNFSYLLQSHTPRKDVWTNELLLMPAGDIMPPFALIQAECKTRSLSSWEMDNLNKEFEFKTVFTSTEIDIKGITFLSILGNVLTV